MPAYFFSSIFHWILYSLMPARIHVVHRVVGAVQVPGIGGVPLSPVRIPAEEPARLRVIEPCVQLQQARGSIVDRAGILQLIVKSAVAAGLALGHLAEVVISIGYHA